MAFRDPKFESYLKKTLSQTEYEQVKIFEACVIVSSNDKYAHRFVFVTDRRMAVTANPPKSILWTVHLADVVSIDRVYDSASFLQKELRDSVQHIFIKHHHHHHNESGVGESRSDLSSTSSLASVGGGGSNKSTEDVHIYILNVDSYFHPLVCSLWTSHLLEWSDGGAHSDETTVTKFDNNKVSVVFHSIYRKLLAQDLAQTPPEQIYTLIHELKLMLKSCVFAKSLFWRSSELFATLNTFLTFYNSSTRKQRSVRADEIECATLILETMTVALEKTETLGSCHKAIQQCSKKFYESLMCNLLERPRVGGGKEINGVMRELCGEYTRASALLIYQLLATFDRCLWWSRYRQVVNRRSLSEIIINHSKHLCYVEELTGELIALLCECDQSPPPPNHLSHLYKIASTLHHFAHITPSTLQHMSHALTEQFTYLVKPKMDSWTELRGREGGAARITRDLLHDLHQLLQSPTTKPNYRYLLPY